MTASNAFALTCPLPLSRYPKVLMAHGSGGRLMQQLIKDIFYAAFDNPELLKAHDGAALKLPTGRIAVSTDSYVVQPLFFPGGDIGMLAINGTVNDLAMCGARPAYLSAAFILEEGLDMETLWRVVQSMRKAADAAGVAIVTGDTKVVERGHGDGIYVNTTGIGVIEREMLIGPEYVCEDDAILVSGDIGRHGIAVMTQREGLNFATPIESDCAALHKTVQALLDANIDIHCLRDATRGGLAAVLNEIASSSGLPLNIDETAVPIDNAVRGACEILGFDPMYVACEGRFTAFVAKQDADKALAILNRHNPLGNAALIGHAAKGRPGIVTVRTSIGGQRILDMPSGELLPRIC